ncbi:MAG: nicotinate-nucleotide adenylyltransferase [Butyrivibrio sp.]|nr:nicotinate-nucleotide adenylyltransferase [Butyrivibrio sp.]
MREKKIGIVGGTFNPIHYAHLLLGEAAREQFALSRVIFIPSGISYLKSEVAETEGIPSGEIRYQLVKLAIEDNPYFTCSRIEIDRPGPSYSADTLTELQRMYPGDELYFVVGADSLLYMENWKRPEEIFSRATILAAIRDDTDMEALARKKEMLAEKFDARIELLHFPRLDISSTEIRERLRSGRSVRYLMPEDCVEFIRLKNLYSAVMPQEPKEDDDVRIWSK